MYSSDVPIFIKSFFHLHNSPCTIDLTNMWSSTVVSAAPVSGLPGATKFVDSLLLVFSLFFFMLGIVVSELQVLLESVDIPEHLSICVDPLLQISISYPEVGALQNLVIEFGNSIRLSPLVFECLDFLQALSGHRGYLGRVAYWSFTRYFIDVVLCE